MVDKRKYGVVYTPNQLADFAAELLIAESDDADNNEKLSVLDPACGESALIMAMMKKKGLITKYIGIDIDKDIIRENIKNTNGCVAYYGEDFIIPNGNEKAIEYWKNKIGVQDYIIANPPWSVEKIYEKTDLKKAGYTLIDGQYDNYVLFIELCLKLLKKDGVAAFILPDSIFSEENKKLRKLLCEKTNICVIARLGEKLFKGVNRATSILIIKNKMPDKYTVTKCFRLGTDERKLFLNNKTKLTQCYQNSVHEVKQSRFLNTTDYLFEVDMHEEDEKLIRKIENDKVDWETIFSFGRGVEISKSGKVVICKNCNHAQGYTKTQENNSEKKCSNCGIMINVDENTIRTMISEKKTSKFTKKIYVGENLHRYSFNGNKYIELDVEGINYKDAKLYEPPKILIRKTGLGIDACIDNKSTYISQTIYSCQYINKQNQEPLEYYLAILNSRVIYYYYIKKYGENEWKSHPYFTKTIIFSLPIKKYVDTVITREIVELTKSLLKAYDRETDLYLEEKIIELYGLNDIDVSKIREELNELPSLMAINNMKF